MKAKRRGTDGKAGRPSIHAYLEGLATSRTQRMSKARKVAEAQFDRFENEEAEKASRFAPSAGIERLETRIQLIASDPVPVLRWTGPKSKKPPKPATWKPGKKAPKGWKVVTQTGHRIKAPKGWTPDQPDPPGTKRIAIVQSRSSKVGTFGARSPIRETPKLRVLVRHEGSGHWKLLDKADRRSRLQVALFDSSGRLVAPLATSWTWYRGEAGAKRLEAFRKAEVVPLLPRRIASIRMKGATVEEAIKRLRFPDLRYGQQCEFEYRVHFWTVNPETGLKEDHVVRGAIYEDWRRTYLDPNLRDENLTSRQKSITYTELVQRQLAISIRSQLAHSNHPARFTTMKRLEGGLAAYQTMLEEEGLPMSQILKSTLGDTEGIPRKLQTRKQRQPLFQHMRARGELPGVLITENEFDRLAALDQARDCHLMVWSTVWDLPA